MARMRNGIKALEDAANDNDSRALYEALRKDLIRLLSTLKDPKDYLQCSMMIMRLQTLLDKSGLTEEDTYAKANEELEEKILLIKELESQYYKEYLGDEDENSSEE